MLTNPRLVAVQDLGLGSPASFFSIIQNRSVSTRRRWKDERLRNALTFATAEQTAEWNIVSRKEVFQPHLPVRLPCYDLAPITGFALGRPSR